MVNASKKLFGFSLSDLSDMGVGWKINATLVTIIRWVTCTNLKMHTAHKAQIRERRVLAEHDFIGSFLELVLQDGMVMN